jgi:hypothetical protein
MSRRFHTKLNQKQVYIASSWAVRHTHDFFLSVLCPLMFILVTEIQQPMIPRICNSDGFLAFKKTVSVSRKIF